MAGVTLPKCRGGTIPIEKGNMNRENVFPLVFPEHVPGTLWVSPRLICAENLVPQCVYALGKQGFENQAVYVVRRGGAWAFDPDGLLVRVLFQSSWIFL